MVDRVIEEVVEVKLRDNLSEIRDRCGFAKVIPLNPMGQFLRWILLQKTEHLELTLPITWLLTQTLNSVQMGLVLFHQAVLLHNNLGNVLHCRCFFIRHHHLLEHSVALAFFVLKYHCFLILLTIPESWLSILYYRRYLTVFGCFTRFGLFFHSHVVILVIVYQNRSMFNFK